MHTRIINIVVLILATLALSSCAGLLDHASGEESFKDMAMPRPAGAKLSVAQHEQMGDRYADEGDGQKAYMHYAKALEKVGPESPEGLTLRTKTGLLILAQGLDEQALAQFQQILAIDPNHALANEAAGDVYLRAGLTAEAEAHLNRALQNDAYLWRAHHLLGVLHSRQNRFDLAVEEYNSSLALAPDQAETLNNLGVAQLAQGRYDMALSAFQRALKAGAPKEKTYNNVGLALARMGKDQEALEAFKYAGDEAKAYNNLGYVLLLMGDTQRAVVCFEKAIQLSPSYYGKAFENLKQARMAEQFRQAGLDRPQTQSLAPAPAVEPASFTIEDQRLAPDPRPLNQNELPGEEPADESRSVTQEKAAVINVPAPAPAMPEVPAEPAVQAEPVQEEDVEDVVENVSTTDPINIRPAVSLAAAEADLRGSAAAEPGEMVGRGLTLNTDAEIPTGAVEAGSEQTGPAEQAAAPLAEPAYGLHVSSFKTVERARNEIAQLSTKGVDAYAVLADLGDKGQWYRVMAGRYDTRADAKKDAARTASLLGFDQLPIIEFKEPPLSMPPSESEGPVL